MGTMTRKNFFSNDADGWDFLKRQFTDEVNGSGNDEIVVKDTCGMCGRTILTGEKTELFSAHDSGKPVTICLHCRNAARDAGFKQRQ